jgi:hypothetical protein
MGRPIRVAVLGGGMGSLAAAWELTEKLRGETPFEVTVYQRDWLLGGKGASTRNLAPGLGNRIEEHGLHVLMGFYDNAFALLRSCYAEASDRTGLRTPFLPWEQAFTPLDAVFAAEQLPSGTWDRPWEVWFPPNSRLPGIDRGTPSIIELFAEAGRWLVHFWGRLVARVGGLGVREALSVATEIVPALTGFATADLDTALPRLLDAIERLVRSAWDDVERAIARGDDELRHLWIGFDFVALNLIGALRARILRPPHDFSVIDDQDYRRWLAGNQLVPTPPELSWDSPPVRALYDLAFSREQQLAAGTVLFNALHIFLGYKGHLAYKMNAAMGEIVFVPLYLALRARGVRFRFFSRVTALRLDGNAVGRVDLVADRPAPEDYDPLRLFRGADGRTVYGWPDDPGVPAGPERPFTISRGNDFDVVVLGIGVGALGSLCQELIAAAPATFGAMVESSVSLPTQSVQLWLRSTMAQLGWDRGAALLSGYERPFRSWADMTHLLPREAWPPGSVQSIAYLCDALLENQGDVKEEARRWLTTEVLRLWPRFTWNALYDPRGRVGPDRLDAQCFRANTDRSDRYVIPAPGTVALRLAPGGSGFSNLALAGDWVRTPLNTGCLEAAVMGGLEAARAIRAGLVHP